MKKSIGKILATILLFGAANSGSLAADKGVVEGQPETWCIAEGDFRIVPNLLGMKPEEAKKLVEACGLVWAGDNKTTATSYLPIGTIGLQIPAGGSLTRVGGGVSPSISLGFHLPDFIGETQSDAMSWLTERQFFREINITTQRDAAPVGQIIFQSPINGVGFSYGSPMNFIVSEGLWVDLPNVVGMKWELAMVKLRSLGLTPSHAGGDLGAGDRAGTNCELIVWYPVVQSMTPSVGSRVFEGDGLSLTTVKRDITTTAPFDANGNPCE